MTKENYGFDFATDFDLYTEDLESRAREMTDRDLWIAWCNSVIDKNNYEDIAFWNEIIGRPVNATIYVNRIVTTSGDDDGLLTTPLLPIASANRLHFFVPAYFQEHVTAHWTYVGDNLHEAWKEYIRRNDELPCEFFCYREADGMLFWHGREGWIKSSKAWIVVRHNPGFNYPETVVSYDGIFTSMDEAEKYIKKNGGSWKIYTFNELQYKMAESIRLEEELKEIQEKENSDELPF